MKSVEGEIFNTQVSDPYFIFVYQFGYVVGFNLYEHSVFSDGALNYFEVHKQFFYSKSSEFLSL